MNDSSGNTAETSTVNGGLIAVSSGTDPGAEFKLVHQQINDPVDVAFSKVLKSAGVMVVDHEAMYSNDHHVKTVGAGSTGWEVVEDATVPTVRLENARAFISDNSGHDQDDNESFVTLLVIGFYS
jgi:hypothetical protein